MRIVVEDYPYSDRELRGVVPPRLLGLPDRHGQIRPHHVGYCYNRAIDDCVFFLPKVVLTRDPDDIDDSTGRGLVFGRYEPVDLLDPDSAAMQQADKAFVADFAMRICRAIEVFYKDNETSTIVCRQSVNDLDASANRRHGSIIDTIMSLLRFARDNKDFVMFEVKNSHSGHNRINWRKTVSSLLPVRQGRSLIYPDPINKKRQTDLDDELLVIFYSILNHISERYSAGPRPDIRFDIIRGAAFDRYLDGQGTARLRRIRYRYFSDKAVRLWTLCMAYFEQSERLRASRDVEDYLVAKDFNIVFEAIIESLIGDDVPPGFKDQHDGKVIDHIYRHDSLINPSAPIYHIADSKYYKEGSPIGAEAVYKQFTYARNVIQQTFDIERRTPAVNLHARGWLPYRDPVTEGYNVTPNFFISAKIYRDPASGRYTYADDCLRPHDTDIDGVPLMRHRQYQFENRLFDRDTLFLSHYDINFLYVISLYGSRDGMARESFRQRVRSAFRTYVVRLLDRYYSFYRIDIPEADIPAFVSERFRTLAGKLYHFDGNLILALERGHKDSDTVLADICRSHTCKPYRLS